MRTGTADAHVADEHVQKLRDLVEARPAQEPAERINPAVVLPRLPGELPGVPDLMHGPKFVHEKLLVIQARAILPVNERPGRLPPLHPPNQAG